MLVYKGGADNTTRPLLGWHANGHATMELFHAVLLELCHAPCQRDDQVPVSRPTYVPTPAPITPSYKPTAAPPS